MKENQHSWVSRGGIKLNKAVEVFDVNILDKICLDIGCSTGGFSDVLLKYKAKKIYAVDVGYGQFDWKLRNSEKVTLLERTNARNLSKKIISEPIDIVVCDVSFISIKKVLLPIKQLIKEKYEIISLIKPQFEVTKELVGKGGIVRDEDVHRNICREIKLWLSKNFLHKIIKIIESPILGQKGNKEFLIYLRN